MTSSRRIRFDVLTLFPGMFLSPLGDSILQRAQQKGILTVGLHDIREHTHDRHRTVDDVPYGGGGGMVMMPGPLVAAIEAVRAAHAPERVIALSPHGRLFTEPVAVELAQYERLALVCGRYEGMDERVLAGYTDDVLSIGDFVLSGGELAAMVVIDAVTRLLPGVLGNELGAWQESLSDGCLEYPQYTRPRVFRGVPVPDVLLSGDHARIARWRRWQSLQRTRAARPDLWARVVLDEDDEALARSVLDDAGHPVGAAPAGDPARPAGDPA